MMRTELLIVAVAASLVGVGLMYLPHPSSMKHTPDLSETATTQSVADLEVRELCRLQACDVQLLQALYNLTNGSAWRRDCSEGWNMTRGAIPCNGNASTWRRVHCNSNGRVSHVDLSHCGLAGSLPESVFPTSELLYIKLSGNQLRGTLPVSWSSFSNLETVDLSQNQLSCPLPASWGNLSGLRVIDLSHNQLSCPLPASWGNLSSLYRVYLGGNPLSSPVPTSWSSLPDLE